MKIELSTDAAVPYSDAEQELFDLLPVGGKNAIASTDLVEKRYGRSPPFHALSIVRTTLGSLARKVEINREGFSIERTGRSGPHPIKFWVKTKEAKERA